MLVRINHLELTTESNKTRLSIIRFYMVLGFLGLLRDDIGDSYLVILLQKNLIIFTQSNAKDD